MNSVSISGRLTADPEQRSTNTGKVVASFTLAVKKRFKPRGDGPDSDFIRCQAWDKSAEYLCNYASKGRLVGVEGRLQVRKYTANDGSNREVTEVVCEALEILDRPRDEGSPQSSPESSPPAVDEYDPFADE